MVPHPAARRALAATALVLLGGIAAPSAFADATPGSRASALYGSTDPKFDGVFRQSLAFLAQNATDVTPAKEAVDWLAGQQCADGGYPGYRADTTKPCDPQKDEFTDQTATAVQALAAVGGRSENVRKGLDWLKAHQNTDGGWGMNPGAISNANSTAAAIGAFAAANQDPAKATAKSGKSPYDALLSLQLGCGTKETGTKGTGAFAWAPQKSELPANDSATAAALLAAQGHGFLVQPAGQDDKPVKAFDCPSGNDRPKPKDAPAAADAAAAYLAKRLDASGGHLESAMPGAPKGPDFGSTADAVLALAAGGHRTAAAGPLKWLRSKDSKAAEWARGDSGKGDPARLAKLVLAAHAAGADPRDFGGTDLVSQLNATGPKPDTAAANAEEKKDESGTTFSVWWFVGVFFVASIGVGFLISSRRKKQP